MNFRHFAALAAVLSMSLVDTAAARQVHVPIRVDNAFLQGLLVQQVYTDPQTTARVWADGNDCSEITLKAPRVGSAAALVRISSDFDAKLGAGVSNWCLGVTDWHGRIDVLAEPVLHPTRPIVEFRVVDSHVFNADGAKTLSGTIWDWFKARVHPQLEAVRVDLYAPLTELRLFLPLALPDLDANRSQRLIDSVRIVGATPEPGGLRVDVSFEVPDPLPASTTPSPEPTLSVEELERWQQSLERWDGFVTFLVKRAGRDVETVELQRTLGEILLEARYDLVEALRPTQVHTTDPVRPLFLETWNRLVPVLRDLSLGLPGEDAVRYLSLVTAGDALAAMDGLGPEFGLQISSDGLRRLARMVEPEAADPTGYDTDVDPQLRRMLGFGEPLPVPTLQPTPTPGVEPMNEPGLEATPTAPAANVDAPTEAPTVLPQDPNEPSVAHDPNAVLVDPTPGSDATTTAPAPTQPRLGDATVGEEWFDEEAPLPTATPALRLEPQSRLERWLWPAAYAAPFAAEQQARLYRWVPQRDELPDYLSLVRDALLIAAQQTRDAKKLAPRWHTVFRDMVLATAWQETCWRQFVKKGGKVDTIRSPVGSVGIMQVNAKVWRGFYDLKALQQDLAYNARAGSEITHHYMVDYAINKGEERSGGSMDAVARATYSAYNAGPGRLKRYRQGSGHRIDRKYWEKYQQVKAGKELAVASCFGLG